MTLHIGTRDETVARMSSLELSHWMALYTVKAEEAERAKDLADSDDGILYVDGQRVIQDIEDDDGDR